MKRLLTLACLLPLSLLAACSTVMDLGPGPETQSVLVQTVQGFSKVSGVRCVLSNDAGKWFVTAPGSVTVRKSSADLDVDCKADNLGGHESVVAKANGSLWSNIAAGGFIGPAVERNPGTGFDYPYTVSVNLHEIPDMTGIHAVAMAEPDSAGSTDRHAAGLQPATMSGMPGEKVRRPDQAGKATGDPKAREWSEKSFASGMKGAWTETIRQASAAIELDPGLADAYTNRCWGYLEIGYMDEALADCNAALGLDPDNAIALNDRGVITRSRGEFEAALADFAKACKSSYALACTNQDKMIAAQLEKAKAKFAAGDWAAVIEMESRIITAAPDRYEAFITRSGAYANQGRLQEALADIETAIRLNPDAGLAYNNRGYIYKRMNNPRLARLDYETACNLKVELGCENLRAMQSR